MVRDPSLANVLAEEQAMAFHCTTAQLLFLSARVQWDIQPTTAFLEVAGQRRLGQGQEGAELSERYSAHANHPLALGRLVDALKMVGRCGICHAR